MISIILAGGDLDKLVILIDNEVESLSFPLPVKVKGIPGLEGRLLAWEKEEYKKTDKVENGLIVFEAVK